MKVNIMMRSENTHSQVQTNFRVCARAPLAILHPDWLLRRMKHCDWPRELSIS